KLWNVQSGQQLFTFNFDSLTRNWGILLVVKGPQGRINRAIWGTLNETMISGGEDSVIRIWDSEVFLMAIY
ncbi:eukaryotic translation initiation factor 3 subunit I-like, partial [Trifolium medium]|nr:eukaryotic translation initiation factor 3 subunit I-like [Trifolium medium]